MSDTRTELKMSLLVLLVNWQHPTKSPLRSHFLASPDSPFVVGRCYDAGAVPPRTDYSCRSATRGSIRAARRAGM